MSEHLPQDELAGLAMLDEDDPERIRAARHAAECAECRAALASAASVLAAIDDVVDPPPPSPEALVRARDAVRAQMAPRPWGSIAAVAALAVASFALPLALMRRVDEIPWLLTIAVLAIVTGRTAVALAKDTPRDSGVALALALGISGVLAVLDADGDHGGHGLNCALLELGAAVLPGAAAIVLARTGRIEVSPLSAAAVAATGALAGQLALHALCADRELDHLLPFHFGAVIASALIAGLVQRAAARAPA